MLPSQQGARRGRPKQPSLLNVVYIAAWARAALQLLARRGQHVVHPDAVAGRRLVEVGVNAAHAKVNAAHDARVLEVDELLCATDRFEGIGDARLLVMPLVQAAAISPSWASGVAACAAASPLLLSSPCSSPPLLSSSLPPNTQVSSTNVMFLFSSSSF